jgi:hypothetical protein
MILVLGILSLVTGPCAAILGPIAWIMGKNDLKEMAAGTMDRSGEGATNAGRICGMIATILVAAVIVIYCLIFIFGLILAGAGAGANA